MIKAVHSISRAYLLVAILALFFGLTAPGVAGIFSPCTTFFLAIIFFLTALKLDFKEVIKYLRDWRMVAETSFLMLLVIPIAVYFIMVWLEPSLAIPFVILAAMPTAMAAPLVVEFMGGKQSLALVITAVTSLLAPLTVPLIIEFIAGAQIEVSFWSMFINLAKVIFIPFILAEIFKNLWRSMTGIIIKKSSHLSVILLGLIIASVASRQAGSILSALTGGQALSWLIWLVGLFLTLHIFGYISVFWKSRQDKFTISVCLTYMNFLLAIYLVDNFFSHMEVELPVILSVVPWALMLPLSGLVSKRLLSD